MSQNVLRVNTRTLQTAKYHVKTNLGVSKGYYQHSTTQPIHGTGQGSGNSPTIWCFVCSALFDAFASKAHGATFASYDKEHEIRIFMIGFVDDCTQRVNVFNDFFQPPPASLIATMEKDAQLWNDLLWVSGGSLEHPKCSFHLIESNWNNDGHPFLKGGVGGTPILISHNGITTPICQKSNYMAHKTLGCYINPAYSQVQTWNKTMQKNNDLAILLETNYFTRSEAWTFYTAIYLPSITYPLPITPLKKSQCANLDARFLRTLLPRCGYNRNMPSAVRYAPFNQGGAGFKQIYVEQGALLVQQIHKYLNSPDTPIGKILVMAISWTQAFLGTSGMFLTDVHQPIPPIGPSLLLDLRSFLQEINGQIRLQHPPTSHLLRQNDRFIMDIVLQQRRWTQRHIQQINSCRRYLQAQTLADNTNVQGTRIQTFAISGTDLPTRDTLRISSFNQPRPGKAAWITWRKFLQTICNSQAVLLQPLNNWIVDVSRVRHWPPTVYDEENDQLYTHYRGSLYYMHARIHTRVFSIRPLQELTTAKGFPSATAIVMDTLRPRCNYMQPTQTPALPSCIQAAAWDVRVSEWEQELLQQSTELADTCTIVEFTQTGNILSCSDGSATTQREHLDL